MKPYGLTTNQGDKHSLPHLPMTRNEVVNRGWEGVDIVFVTGDAYVDHPSFAMAILGRVLESNGFRIAILSQPNWRSCDAFKEFGKPRLFFAVSAGNMDSLINHYTANRKMRNDDAYSPGGRIGLRPDRATLVYSQRCKEAYTGVPVVVGGVEASLRRLAHYDYWSDTVKRSILLDSKADLLVYGMGERPVVEIARRLSGGEILSDLRSMRGIAYALGEGESPAEVKWTYSLEDQSCFPNSFPSGVAVVPNYQSVKTDKLAFAEATRIIHINTNPHNAKVLVQYHDRRAVIVTPPDLPLSQSEMDYVYDLPYTRRPHPSYTEPIPAHQMIKDSITIMRGCFGGCTFCSITTHQGRIIQSRSEKSVITEVNKMANDPDFKGVISDIGGPTANMYEMKCVRPEVEAKCKRLSCVHPTICKLLGTDHEPLIRLMKHTRDQAGIKRVFVASGVRMDLAELSPKYVRDLAKHHVGGYLKVAPEHSDPKVLGVMKKPDIASFERFEKMFKRSSLSSKKPKQYLVPYFISGHPGSGLKEMIDLAVFLKRNGHRPDQVQDFIPAPFDVATCMYHTGIEPFSRKPVQVAKHLRERRLQRALLQFFKPQNYFEVREALVKAGRTDLIGRGCDALISDTPPQEALRARRKKANRSLRPLFDRSPADKRGYRPHRSSATRRTRAMFKPEMRGQGCPKITLN